MLFPFHSFAFIDGVGTPEMVMIFIVVLVLFGGQKLPEFARGLGKSIKEFKKAAAGVEEEFKRAIEDDEVTKAPKILPLSTPPAALPAPSAVDATNLVTLGETSPAAPGSSATAVIEAAPSSGGETAPEAPILPTVPVSPVVSTPTPPPRSASTPQHGRADV